MFKQGITINGQELIVEFKLTLESYLNPDVKDEIVIRGIIINKKGSKGSAFAYSIPIEKLHE